uniref:General transcription factor IIH subunit n=1 Tax=Parastrongyloides trichosuri TaxID=131310 RepID=A0A0N4Z232_PARTI
MTSNPHLLNDDEDGNVGYAWEKAYTEGLKIKDILQEDADIGFEEKVKKLVEEERRKERLKNKPERCRLGVLRYVYLVIDLSNAMSLKTMQPSRLEVVVEEIQKFIDKFFSQNPVSQLGIIVCKDKKAEKLCNLTGNQNKLKESIKNIKRHDCRGEFSLQNGIHLAYRNFEAYPIHSSREVIVFQAALATCDAEDIFDTMEKMLKKNIRISAMSLSAFLYVTKTVCQQTGGTYKVILDKTHLELTLSNFVIPPIIRENADSNLIMVGFPQLKKASGKVFCQCHRKSNHPHEQRGYFCHQCGSLYCSVPVECKICHVILASAPLLTKTFTNMLPLKSFEEVKIEEEILCKACTNTIEKKAIAYQCHDCKMIFCMECDALIHDSLQICPGCH